MQKQVVENYHWIWRPERGEVLTPVMRYDDGIMPLPDWVTCGSGIIFVYFEI